SSRGVRTQGRGSSVYSQLALGDRHGVVAVRHNLGAAIGPRPGDPLAHLSGDAETGAFVTTDDCRDAGIRIYDAVWRTGCHNGPGICEHRRLVPFLLADAWMAGCCVDWERYLFQCAV